MRAEFLIDDENEIWLHYIEDVYARSKYVDVKKQQNEYKTTVDSFKPALEENKREQDFTDFKQTFLLDFERVKDDKTMDEINELSGMMFKQFKHMKNDTGIMDVIDESEDHEETNQALKELYPDAVFTFDDITAHNSRDPSSALGKYIANRSQSPPQFNPELASDKSFYMQESQNIGEYNTHDSLSNINLLRK